MDEATYEQKRQEILTSMAGAPDWAIEVHLRNLINAAAFDARTRLRAEANDQRQKLITDADAFRAETRAQADARRDAERARLDELRASGQITNAERLSGYQAASEARDAAYAQATALRNEQVQKAQAYAQSGSDYASQIYDDIRAGRASPTQQFALPGELPPPLPREPYVPDTRSVAERQDAINAEVAERNKIFEEMANLPPIPVAQAPVSSSTQGMTAEQANKIVDNLYTTNNLSLTNNPEIREQWVDYFQKGGLDRGLNEFKKVFGEAFEGAEFGQDPRYGTGEIITYETSRDLIDSLFQSGGFQKTGFNDDGTPVEDVYRNWVRNSQYRPIEETISLWSANNPGSINQEQLGAFQKSEAERLAELRKENVGQFDSAIEYILSSGAQQQQFQPQEIFQPTIPQIPQTPTTQQPTFQPQLPQEPFYPEFGDFQTQQPGFQPQQPVFQSPTARPLITEAERPTLDQTVQFIESGGTFPQAGVEPMQQLSPYDLGSTFQTQTEPYFAVQPVNTGIAQIPVYGTVPTQALPVVSSETGEVTAPVGMQQGGNVSGVKAAAQQLAAMGRNGDTMLAHITPQEAGILKALGGSGTINPKTGLREYWINWVLGGLMVASTAATISEQKKQRQSVEAAQRRQQQERAQQIARARQSYERSGLQDIPLVSEPVQTSKDIKFDPLMGGVRPGEGVPEIPVPESGGIAALQPAPTAPPAMSDDEKRRRAMGIAGGGVVALAGGGMTYMEAGGTTGSTGVPRDVTGTGDGMSDSVPATIEGVQEARLADGEFVIPADVVADIGNGSSDAGSKKLYDMMDRIRKARHGTTEQPPEINAEALMPA